MELWQWYYEESDNNWVSVTWTELRQRFDEGVITPDTMVTWDGLGAPGVPFRYINAEYFYYDGRLIQHAYTEDELHAAASEGRINLSTQVWGRTLPSKGIRYDSLQFVDLTFVPDIRQFIEMRRDQPTTVLSGPNDSGKTLILKLLRRDLGPTTNFIACNRFYHLDRLNPATEQDAQYARRHENFVTQLYQQRQNTENNDFQIQQVISQLKDPQRDTLLTLCSKMLGEEFRLEQVDPENKLSQHYIDVGGQNLAVSSTGTRLLMMIVAACLDDHYCILLVDEPELGLSPSLQAVLARYLFHDERRQKYFPHMKQLFIATHSHLFLDRGAISNNFVVTKVGNEISIRQVDSWSAYHDLQFNMLGNHLEALFLPAAIVIVEGDTDYDYIKRVFLVFFSEKRISVVWSGGADDTRNKLHVIDDSLGGLMKSPYRERVFILLDKRRFDKKQQIRERDFEKYGVPLENVIVLEKSGIEYYYPPEILAKVFACRGADVFSLLQIEDNAVKVHDIEMAKKQLCREVVDRLTSTSEIPQELQDKLLDPISRLLA